MLRTLLICVLLFSPAMLGQALFRAQNIVAAAAGITFKNSVSTGASGPGANGGTTSAVDMTGANTLIMFIGGNTTTYSSAASGCSTSGQICDSSSNTWTHPTGWNQVFGGFTLTIWIAVNATVSSSQTFTVNCSGCFPPFVVEGFAGVKTTSPADQHACGTNNNNTGGQYGSVTATENNDLYVIGIGLGGQSYSSPSLNSGYTLDKFIVYDGATHYGLIVGYFIQGTAAALNPTSSWTSNADNFGCNGTFLHS